MADVSRVDVPDVAPPRGYAHAVVTSGSLVHVAGQVALDATGTTVAIGDFAGQFEQALVNLEAVLAAAGSAFAAVASLTVYCVASAARDRLGDLRAPLRRRSADGRPPAITVVLVHGLLDEDWLVEVQAVAAIDGTPAAPSPTAAGTAA